MKILIDMNLSPKWVEVFRQRGWSAEHWSTVGDPRATDAEVLAYAREHGFVLFTHDLDFGAILAAGSAEGPSVVQIRSQNVTPTGSGVLLCEVLAEHGEAIEAGALLVVQENRVRVRILPLR